MCERAERKRNEEQVVRFVWAPIPHTIWLESISTIRIVRVPEAACSAEEKTVKTKQEKMEVESHSQPRKHVDCWSES